MNCAFDIVNNWNSSYCIYTVSVGRTIPGCELSDFLKQVIPKFHELF